ncbi:MAG TPA: hypothetical protein ENG92_03400, partial [Thiolapillus brandeum]|nr:hypothetical protein [Thiolapillus brandeum]
MKTNDLKRKLHVDELYHACNLDLLEFKTSSELERLSESIGQERALEAIEFGVGMPHEGFNLYVMGSSGLGRHTLVKQSLTKPAQKAITPHDWCYVANFSDPPKPNVLKMPAGTGRRLRQDMQQLVGDLLAAIPAAFRSDEYLLHATEINEDFEARKDKATNQLDKQAAEQGIALLRSPSGFYLTPQRKGKPLSPEEFKKLPEEDKQRYNTALDAIKKQLKETMGHILEWQREMQHRFQKLNRETVELTVTEFIGELEDKYQQVEDITTYLASVKLDIIENVNLFREAVEDESKIASAKNPEFMRYQVNILVDNAETQGAPVIFEDNPTYQNLLGRVEYVARFGTLHTDFTLIKSGAMHRANGGFLILDAEKLLANPFAWDGLKRSIKSREIRIEPLERQLSLASTISLEPQPIPINLKIILIGNRLLYYLLKDYDPEFGLLFKVTADFEEELPREGGNELLYARLIATLQQREGLREITRNGVARIIEYCARQAYNGEKLSLHLGDLLELLQEANYQANERNSELIHKEDVQSAIDAHIRRISQLQEQLHEDILKDRIKIETRGAQLAQVNGLNVIQLGDYAFGTPTRISATARMGSGELTDIERETEQGGPLHSKGVLILTSYLGQRYAKNQPLTISASLVFEQTYSQVEGDSASAAELCALLSAIGDIPIKQSLAIT